MALCGEKPPRTKASLNMKGPPLVFLGSGEEPGEIFSRINSVWDAHFSHLFKPGARVLIKINLNTSDPYPASTCPSMLAVLVGFLHERGINSIAVGDCSSVSALPTRKVAQQAGILETLPGSAKMVYFDEGPWVKVRMAGQFLQEVTVPGAVYEADRIIYLANLKTHHVSDFTFGLKLAVGFMHPLERYPLHRGEHLKQKIPEISLAVQPDLTIIDGRTAFITGGPRTGRAEKAGVFIMGSEQLSVDVEAYRQLYLLKKRHGCLEHFKEDPFEMPQLEHARKCLPGGKAWAGYECVKI